MIILTEKPSVAESFASALGGFTKSNGYYSNTKGDCIISAAGHLLELYMLGDYDSKFSTYWKETFDDLPYIPNEFKYKPIPDKVEKLKQIKSVFQKFDSSELLLATDAEREGELIGALILNYIGFKNYSTAKRFWVSEALTPDVVKKGIAQAKPLSVYEGYKNAGYARSQADWLIGINLTRFISVSVNTTCSFGRVQTAVLGAIYLRDMSIRNFKPEPYYQLQVKVSKNTNIFPMFVIDENGNTKFSDLNIITEIKNNLNNLKEISIVDVVNEEKKELPPQLFSLTSLQKYCSNIFKINPDETLNIAQKLYEEYKCLSYPRTPSTVLGNDNVQLFQEKYEFLSKKYPKLCEGCNSKYITNENKRIFNSDKLRDHHALIPLSDLPLNANEKEKMVYSAVITRFFQVIKEPYIYNSTTVTAEAVTDSRSISLIAKGNTTIQIGWKINSPTDNNDSSENDEEKAKLPVCYENEKLNYIGSEILMKFTKPKNHFTNSTILALMENPQAEKSDDIGKLVGIGTPATRADIIAKLIEKKYIQQQKQQLIITDLGIFLIETVIKIPALKEFISIKTTTLWEEELQSNPSIFLTNIKNFLKTEMPKMKITETWSKENLGSCPVCNKGVIYEADKTFYCSEYKAGCKMHIFKNINGAKITAQDAITLINGKVVGPKKMKSKTGNTYYKKLKLKLSNNISEIQLF